MQSFRCSLIIDPPAPGDWNMAVDEALLLDAVEHGIAALRFYQWIEPTLSLGYFQRYDGRRDHAASADCAVVRRQTGGGAILHDRELTYSLTLPASHWLARQTEKLYAATHDAFIATLAQLLDETNRGLHLVRRNQPAAAPASEEPFLCFQRRAPGDVLLVAEASDGDGFKVLGSAQRRHRGAVLQHGSLLLGRSAAAPELAGLRELLAIDIEPPDLAARVTSRVAEALKLQLIESTLPPERQSKAAELARSKYGRPSWTTRH